MAANKLNNINFNIPEGNENPDWTKWQIDSGVDYAIYGGNETNEGRYVNKRRVSKETAAEAKALRVRLQGIGKKANESLIAAAAA